MTEQATIDEFQTELKTDGGRTLPNEHPGYTLREDGKPTVTDDWVGEVIFASWGYGQTNVNVARIIDVSESGRTVKAKLVKQNTDTQRGSEQVTPTAEEYGDSFRLYVRESGDDVLFKGSYPFINGDEENGTRNGTFLPWGERESVHQTPHHLKH